MKILDFFINGWKKILIWLGVLALAFGLGGFYGYQYKAGKDAKAVVGQVVKKVESKEANQGIADNSGQALEIKREKVRTVYVTIEKEVDKYVEKNVGSSDAIGANWVCLHDAAARGEAIAPGQCEFADPVSSPGTDQRPRSK